MPESNMSLATSNIVVSLQQKLRPDEYYVIEEDKNNKGFRTDNDLKAVGTSDLREVIQYNQLRFHTHFFTCPAGENLNKYMDAIRTLDFPTSKLNEALINPQSEIRYRILDFAKCQLKEEIVNQLKAWSEEVIVDARGNVKTLYSGKHGGKPDDLCMCLVGGVVMIRKWTFAIRRAIQDNANMIRNTVFNSGYDLVPNSYT